jgi:AAA15 family ATPase/GTPase
MKINKFYINNFRSLIDFRIDDFDTTTIFYGENNAGKSNILKAIELIFLRKPQFGSSGYTNYAINFYQGEIVEFSNNFYNNDRNLTIDFEIELTILKSQTIIHNAITALFNPWAETLNCGVKGAIRRSMQNPDSAEFQVTEIKVNSIIIYESNGSEFKYFPTLTTEGDPNTSELNEAFSHFVEPLNDCVYIIGSSRDTRKTPIDNGLLTRFLPENFKQSLYTLYLDTRTHSIFEEVNLVFNSEPFTFGTISFANINGHLEIMIKDNNVRLPIKHLGSGVEQVLYIITCLIETRSRIVCIEELEQNLSPKLQNLALRKIQAMLGKQLDQVIISSHSSVFANPKLSKAIYLIKKVNSKTVLDEKMNDRLGEKMKSHLIDTAPRYDTYTKDELDARAVEINKYTEERFKA